MSRKSRVILTTMCFIYRNDGSFLVENRIKNDWPGLNLPGGHVEDEESIPESCIREIKEETGLSLPLEMLEPCGYYEWNVPQEGVRHLCLLFRTNDFSGTLKDSSEGHVFWIKKEELKNYPLSADLEEVLALCYPPK